MSDRDRHPIFLAVLLTGMLVASRVLPLPVLDEEGWLDIATQAPWDRPYDWWRPGPPWGLGQEPDAYVFAHPPVFVWWLKSVLSITPDLAARRVLAALPWAALYGICAVHLAAPAGRVALVLGLICGAPAVVLGLQCGLMPDAMVSALGGAAGLCWILGWERRSSAALALAGLLLAAATWTKLPAALLAVAFGLDAARRRDLRSSAPFWIAFLAPLALGEGWLAAIYGRIHLVEVLSRAGEIPRGPLAGRALGTLARLGLVCSPLLLLCRGHRGAWLPGFVLGGLAMAVAWPPGLGTVARLALLGLAVAGGALISAVAALALSASRPPGAHAEREDSFVLACWALLVVAGVVVGHNFSATRYLLPAALPMGVLLCRAAPSRLVAWAVGTQAVLALLLSHAEARYAAAADQVARALVAAHPEGGSFTGEWTFRWRMQQAGWIWTDQAPPSGALLAAPTQGSPSVGDGPGLERIETLPSRETGWRWLLDVDEGVGFYAETLGPLPLGWRAGPLEEGTLWRAR